MEWSSFYFKELPWPGSRCGWIEVFNRKNDPLYERYIKTLLDAKMLEVCSTTLPQMAIPEIYASPKFIPHLEERNQNTKIVRTKREYPR